jgi:hypothetical protein
MVLNGQTRATGLWTGGSRESGGRLRGGEETDPILLVRGEVTGEGEGEVTEGGGGEVAGVGRWGEGDRRRQFGLGAEPERLTTLKNSG